MCETCWEIWQQWLDYPKEPATGWRHYPARPERDYETWKTRTGDRLGFIRSEMIALADNCRKNHVG